jgi:hypothetical protein
LLGVDLIVNQLIIKTHVVLCCIDSDVLPLTLENWMQFSSSLNSGSKQFYRKNDDGLRIPMDFQTNSFTLW